MSARTFTVGDFEPIIGRAVVIATPGGAIGPNCSAVVDSVDDLRVTLRIGKMGRQQLRLASITGLAVFPPAPAGVR